MRLGQIRPDGGVIAAVFEDGLARPIVGHTVADLIRRAAAEEVAVEELAQALASRHGEPRHPIIPLSPPEVWACGCTYKTSAEFRDGELGTREGMYAYVHTHDRPEIFFKATARMCVGPGQSIGIRADSRFTAAEPELAVVLGGKGSIVGYTLANDVSAWDIERENALYLPQSKVYTGGCALGPVIVTADELSDPYHLEMTCTIRRGEAVLFEGRISTSQLNRKIEELVDWLTRSNPVPSATVLLTGTGIIVPEEAALAPGDEVSIRIPEIGELTNRAAVVE